MDIFFEFIPFNFEATFFIPNDYTCTITSEPAQIFNYTIFFNIIALNCIYCINFSICYFNFNIFHIFYYNSQMFPVIFTVVVFPLGNFKRAQFLSFFSCRKHILPVFTYACTMHALSILPQMVKRPYVTFILNLEHYLKSPPPASMKVSFPGVHKWFF